MPLPGKVGASGEIIVVTDAANWNGALGDTLRSIFGLPYAVLPQYEPDSDELGDDDVRRSRAPVPSRPRCRACACARACRERCAPRPARACEPCGV